MELIIVSLYFSAISIVAVVIGQKILVRFHYQASYLQTISIAYPLGLAVIVYGVVFLLYSRMFYYSVVLVSLAITVYYLRRAIIQQLQLLWQKGSQYFFQLFKTSKISFALHCILVILLVINYCAAFAPPIDRDVIAYHLPEANSLVANHHFMFDARIEKFYINLPIFMEVGYALGIMLSGYSLAQLLHYSIVVSLIIFLLGWLRQHYSQNTAVLATISLFALHSFMRIATTALVDSAFISLEIMSMLMVISWCKYKQRPLLMVAGSLVGVALAIKYSPLFTVAFSLGVISLQQIFVQRTGWKNWLTNLAAYIVPALVFGGGWYLKNLLIFRNPIYPFIFGHAGFDDTYYQAIVDVIHDFTVPRTLLNYLELPWLFYGQWWNTPYMLENLFDSPQTLAVLLSLAVLPLIIIIHKKHRAVTWLMAAYMICFSLYWFFIATHQIRFLDTACVVLVLLAIICMTQLEQPLRWIFVCGLGSTLLLIGLYFGTVRSSANLLYTSFKNHIFHSVEMQYTFGMMTRQQYLKQSPVLDCGYGVLDYLQQHDPEAHVLDNWSQGHNDNFKFYNQAVVFYVLPPNLNEVETNQFVDTQKIQYMYFNELARNGFQSTTNTGLRDYYDRRSFGEQVLLNRSQSVYSFDTCQLYQIMPTH